jgi:hypothetical protein
LASSTATISAVPRIAAGCESRIRSSVSLAIASTKPAPSVLVEIRSVLTLSSNGTRSKMSAFVDLDWISEPPSDSTNCSSSMRPVRCSAIWLAPPVTMFW